MLNTWNLVKITLPTLCIFYAFWQPPTVPSAAFREVFGNESLLLDVYLETNPEGYFQKGKPQNLRFTGYLVDGDRQMEVKGRRIDWNGERFYLFESPLGKFRGRLAKNSSGCEPLLQFQLEGRQPAATNGVMKAGFCPNSASL